jgi:hypothetical protein
VKEICRRYHQVAAPPNRPAALDPTVALRRDTAGRVRTANIAAPDHQARLVPDLVVIGAVLGPITAVQDPGPVRTIPEAVHDLAATPATDVATAEAVSEAATTTEVPTTSHASRILATTSAVEVAVATTTGMPGITIGSTEDVAGRIITITTEAEEGREAVTKEEVATGSTEIEGITGAGRETGVGRSAEAGIGIRTKR